MDGSQQLNTPTRPKAPLRRRFSLVAASLLAVLMAVLGVNFAADSGTSSSNVAPIAGITVSDGTPQGWSVSVGSAGTVPGPDDDELVAAIDPGATTATRMLVSVYVTNLSGLSVNYSSWNFNLGLFDVTTPSNPVPVGTTQVITSDSGTVSWVADVNTTKDYAVKLMAGGSFYTIGTSTTSGASLSPKFFVRATEL